MESFPTVELVGVVVCIMMSAYFSGTETALTALSEIKISVIGEKHHFIQPVFKKWADNPGLILSGILIGNNIVNIFGTLLGGNIAYKLMADYKPGIADLTAGTVMTVLILIFGEVTPKTFAKVNPEKVIVPALFIFRMIAWILLPFSYILSKFAHGVVKIMGGKNVSSGLTQMDIEFLIEKGNDQGVFEQEEQGELLTSVLEFKHTLVKEIMTPRTDTNFLETDTTVSEALEKIEKWGHSRIPVFEDSVDNIKGILYVKDMVSLVLKEKDILREDIVSIIRTGIFYVPETQKINETLKMMQAGGTHMAIVVDEFGGTAGIITLEDIIEELVGEIRDEDDHDEDQIIMLKDDVILVDAHISVSDLEEELEICIPDDGEYNSLGGFIVNEVGNVPPEGYVLRYNGYEFKVVESNERHIVKVEIRVLKHDDETDIPVD
ncbi:MAG TPA: hemolysin family protein [bacterium]|nr:hemolysin family protein [bacterium]